VSQEMKLDPVTCIPWFTWLLICTISTHWAHTCSNYPQDQFSRTKIKVPAPRNSWLIKVLSACMLEVRR